MCVPKESCSDNNFFVMWELEFELRASCLLGRHSYHLSHSTSPVCVRYFWNRV
jgi:hypothetical protein